MWFSCSSCHCVWFRGLFPNDCSWVQAAAEGKATKLDSLRDALVTEGVAAMRATALKC